VTLIYQKRIIDSMKHYQNNALYEMARSGGTIVI